MSSILNVVHNGAVMVSYGLSSLPGPQNCPNGSM